MDVLVDYIKFVINTILAGVLVTCGLQCFTKNTQGSICIGVALIAAMLAISTLF